MERDRIKPKHVSVERLAEMCQQEFLAIHEKMDAGFKAVDERLELTDQRFFALLDRMDAGFANMNMRFDEMDQRIDNLKFLDLDKRVTAIERHLKMA